VVLLVIDAAQLEAARGALPDLYPAARDQVSAPRASLFQINGAMQDYGRVCGHSLFGDGRAPQKLRRRDRCEVQAR
jgi:hypothetical protein